MASTESYAQMDWLIRTWARDRLNERGFTAMVATIDGLQPITTPARLNNVLTWLNAREAEFWAAYVPAWESSWAQASQETRGSLFALRAAEMAALWSDADNLPREALKATLRTVGLIRCRQLAGG